MILILSRLPKRGLLLLLRLLLVVGVSDFSFVVYSNMTASSETASTMMSTVEP
jgi:hypothetical protein